MDSGVALVKAKVPMAPDRVMVMLLPAGRVLASLRASRKVHWPAVAHEPAPSVALSTTKVLPVMVKAALAVSAVGTLSVMVRVALPVATPDGGTVKAQPLPNVPRLSAVQFQVMGETACVLSVRVAVRAAPAPKPLPLTVIVPPGATAAGATLILVAGGGGSAPAGTS